MKFLKQDMSKLMKCQNKQPKTVGPELETTTGEK